MDSFRDEVWRNLLLKSEKVQVKYESALPDALPMPKKEFLFPNFDQETWNELVSAYITSLKVLRGQMIYDLVNPLPKLEPWMRKNQDTGLFDTVYER